MNTHPLSRLTPMDMDDFAPETDAVDLAKLTANADNLSLDEAWREFLKVQDRYTPNAQAVRRRLLSTSLAWTDEEVRSACEVHRASDELAVLGHRFSEIFASRADANDARTLEMAARTLYLMGETVKWEVVVTADAAHAFRKPHTLMRNALQAGKHRDPIQLVIDGRQTTCTLESLYFRVLLLARFAGGALNCKQIEILDAWMQLWMPALTGVTEAPSGGALRADLDSNEGLKRGKRPGPGLSLYLPQAPIEKAFQAVMAEFHAGRIVPSEGIASTFAVEEHVAVLDLIRRGLRASRQVVSARADRRSAGGRIELFVGLGEISSRGPAAKPAPAPALTLALVGEPVSEAPRDNPLDDIYGARRRMVTLLDESDTGVGVECAQAECRGLAVGDLVGLRLGQSSPMLLGKVVRRVPSRTEGWVVIGIRRIGECPQQVEVMRERKGYPMEKDRLVYLAGADLGGRQDAYVVSERAFNEGGTFSTDVDGITYRFRYNRARDSGRGWALVGFEIIDARPATRAA